MNRISNPQLKLLAKISTGLEAQFTDFKRSHWKGSPFAWIVDLPSSVKGRIGKELVKQWLTRNGFEVRPSPDREADLLVNGKRAEVKFCLLWESGIYVFQQIRNQQYDLVLCLGLSPLDASCWVIPKDVLFAETALDGLSSQHAGRAGRDTKWLRVSASSPPRWLKPYGGKLTEALSSLRQRT